MNAHNAQHVAAAALRWQTARELRLAAGAQQRRAGAAYKAPWTGDATDTRDVAAWVRRADAAVAETRRLERAALRALAKACASARNDLQAVDEHLAAAPAHGTAMPSGRLCAVEGAAIHRRPSQPLSSPQTSPSRTIVSLV